MKKSTIFQGSMSEPDGYEDWEYSSPEEKNKIIRHQANIIIVLLLVIVVMAVINN